MSRNVRKLAKIRSRSLMRKRLAFIMDNSQMISEKTMEFLRGGGLIVDEELRIALKDCIEANILRHEDEMKETRSEW